MPNFSAGISVECLIPSPVPIKSNPSPEEILFDYLLWSDGSALKNSSLQFLFITNEVIDNYFVRRKMECFTLVANFLEAEHAPSFILCKYPVDKYLYLIN